jgi:hypothetical protein
MTVARLRKNGFRLCVGAVGCITLVEAVVRQPASQVVKRLMAFSERVEEIREPRDVRVRCLSEPVYPGVEDCRLMRIHHAISAEIMVNHRATHKL